MESQAGSSPEPSRKEPSPSESLALAQRTLLAPWWHTALMVLLIVGLSVTGARQLHGSGTRPLHLIPNYLLTTAYEWALAGLVWWGIRMRNIAPQQLIGEWRAGFAGWIADFGAAIVFWVVALLLLSQVAELLQHTWGSHLDPRKIADVTQKLAPVTGGQMVLFLILSISAGICEEFVFRGYFQQQFARLGGHVWIGVALSAVVFGCAHGYEGISGVLLIAAYGAMFGVLALLRRGLRTGMIAHAWHDAISGFVWFLLRHHGIYFGAK